MEGLLAAYVAVAAVLTITPGADMAYVAGATLGRGRRAGPRASAGICAGLLVHATAAAWACPRCCSRPRAPTSS